MESIQNFFVNLWEKFTAWVKAKPVAASLWAGAIILFIIGLFVPVSPPHVSLAGEPLFSDGTRWLTNGLVTTFVVDLVLIILSVIATARMSLVPSGVQNFMELVVEALYNLTESASGDRARQFFPWVATVFLFVLFCNWVGLIPGVGSIGYFHHGEAVEEGSEHALRLGSQLALADGQLILVNDEAPLAQAEAPDAAEEPGEEGHVVFVPLFRAPSADLNMTFALAISTVVMVQIWGVRTQGRRYFDKFLNVSGPNTGMRIISGYVSILEIISEFSRIIAFGFRLFGNIFAGEVVLATMAFLIPFFLPVPFYGLEIFVGVIQALVFMMLAVVFFTMATISHGHEEHGAHGHEEHALPEAQIDAPPVA